MNQTMRTINLELDADEERCLSSFSQRSGFRIKNFKKDFKETPIKSSRGPNTVFKNFSNDSMNGTPMEITGKNLPKKIIPI